MHLVAHSVLGRVPFAVDMITASAFKKVLNTSGTRKKKNVLTGTFVVALKEKMLGKCHHTSK